MKKSNSKQEHISLLNEWQKKYQHQLTEEISFTLDGPINWEAWEHKSNLKILFLLKESHSGYLPNKLPEKIGNSYSQNISRWRFMLKSLYNSPQVKPEFLANNKLTIPGDHFSDIALVEVKKLNTNQSSSQNSEIKKFAQQDKAFLRTQIDLLNPHIVFCCYTDYAYDEIYDDVEYKKTIDTPIEKCQCWESGNRLIIDFYHPSRHHAFRLTNEGLCDVLYEITMQGKIFERFNWSLNN